MKSKLLIFQSPEMDTPVSIQQTGKDRFTVTYGHQVKAGQTYEDAADALGLCILHSLACNGSIEPSL